MGTFICPQCARQCGQAQLYSLVGRRLAGGATPEWTSRLSGRSSTDQVLTGGGQKTATGSGTRWPRQNRGFGKRVKERMLKGIPDSRIIKSITRNVLFAALPSLHPPFLPPSFPLIGRPLSLPYWLRTYLLSPFSFAFEVLTKNGVTVIYWFPLLSILCIYAPLGQIDKFYTTVPF